MIVPYAIKADVRYADGVIPRHTSSGKDGNPTDEERAAVHDGIRELLQPRYFVPLVAPLHSMLPEVGNVWSPDTSAKPSSPIIALAGPMTHDAAQAYRQAWTKPGRNSPRRAELKSRKGIDVVRNKLSPHPLLFFVDSRTLMGCADPP